ncbi:MAG TPA: DUF2087 domain-containing protein [Symbiobacteriaceae bacterium]|nr:DUF2087 domain-containing protein [Symbiobacteriaceae bacterium]
MNELIATASLDQLKAGYAETEEYYTCLCCGQQFEKGIIYPDGGVLYEAGKYTRLHIAREHGSVFAYLLRLDKSVTGLSEIQRRLLELFYQGKSDADVQQELGAGSTSTIRNHRFVLKEKERQARVFLAIMELLRARDKYTPAEEAAGPLRSLPRKQKHRRSFLSEVIRRFESGRTYTESEVNQVLEVDFEDYVSLRRHLVDHGLLHRLPDGSQYWRETPADIQEERNVDRKAELKRLAKETKTEAGVFQIKNSRNGKVFVDTTRNFKTLNGQEFMLEMGSHKNRTLQQEWKEFGKEAFTFEVLEVLDKPETGFFDEKDALKKLKAKWLEQLQPFGERGYNAGSEKE